MSTPRNRSHHGCWTCKNKRRKCDNGRPACGNCRERGVVCEGYELRLRWGSGIASRGRFTGAEKPVGDVGPFKPKGRKRDLEKRGRIVVAEDAVFDCTDTTLFIPSTPSEYPIQDTGVTSVSAAEDDVLFEEFLQSGINILHSTMINDGANMLCARLPELCKESDALYSICLAFQTSISTTIQRSFFEYFDEALSKFRVELANTVSHLTDATLTAGLLLCSLGFMHGLPWTMHIQGMHNILQIHGIAYPPGQRTPFRVHLIEVMGVMDLPTFSIGRQNPCIGIWRRYCRGNRWAGEKCLNRDEVEVVSGLPRSLIDIFSGIGEETKEEDFWNWPGAEGNFLQYQLWEAYRLAGMLAIRRRQMDLYSPTSDRPVFPKTQILASRILSCVDAIRRGSTDPEHQGTLVINAINYPVFMVGLQVMLVNKNTAWKELIRSCFKENWKFQFGKEDALLLGILEEMWERNDPSVDVDQLGQARGMELGLL